MRRRVIARVAFEWWCKAQWKLFVAWVKEQKRIHSSLAANVRLTRRVTK